MTGEVDLRWLVRSRWVLIGVAAALVIGLHLALGGLPWAPMLGLLGVACLSNAVLPRIPGSPTRVATAALAFDVVGLTVFLALSGGANNPFAFLYLLEATIAALVLPRGATWAFVVAVGAAYASLFALPSPPHDHAAMQRHLAGMWLAYAVCGPFVAIAVHGLRRIAAQADAARLAAEQARHRSERLASLATLAAGAAHEIATPLGTIAVVAGELARSSDASTRDDAALLLREVERCRSVLQQLAADAGAAGADATRTLTLGDLVRDALGEAPALTIEQGPADRERVTCPERLVAQALRRLTTNAVQAAGSAVVRTRIDGDRACIEVVDRGPGMDAATLARAGEPFFSTRTEGEGMGLGLYFARAVAEHAGGSLVLESVPGVGTTAILCLPRST
ncbi:MAG: HAMP domain-containing histidine kinase [Alphaproteobacteria bacterium]|nr:HAMP domain-containing histidine kinase [Alphaproteobacteria bacterium]MCB9699162.1 HAMP domain-containing histidine kinase [Alphaproteobacteria bacterium]